jgi:ketol-acid reductoisomerase
VIQKYAFFHYFFTLLINLYSNIWVHTKTVKDISDLDSITVKDIDIFFVDIQGVGKALNFKDEGLGLAVALKKKYPSKKVVIYSAQTVGERFHEGFRKADTLLAKDAEPYEFQQIVEQFGMEIYKDK